MFGASATSAFAQQAGGDKIQDQKVAQAAPAKKAHDPNQVICKSTGETGSRLGGEKKCLTRAQWDAQSAAGSDLVRGIQSPGSANGHF
jgi:hypothetical protein